MATRVSWTDWRVLRDFPLMEEAAFAELIDGGQAFRWQHLSDGSWQGIWAGNLAQLRRTAVGRIEWRAPEILADQVGRELPFYLGQADDFPGLTDRLPWRSDAHLALCLATFPHLRILRQPFGETLLCFLCSATKQIVQIKQMTELLARNHGAPLVAGWNRLPTWAELADVSEKSLRECLLGFRARYIHDTAQFLAQNPGWLEATQHLPYEEAKARLCSLPGVGEKVADCVLLFGAGRMIAFPVDVWIIKTMEKRYGLTGWKPAQIAHFGRSHFGDAAGLAQQFLFAYERREKRRASES